MRAATCNDRTEEMPGAVDSMETMREDAAGSSWIDFPCFSRTGQALMEDVARSIERELGDKLYSSRTPSNVTRFMSPTGNAEGSLVLREGKSRSKVSFVMRSWLRYDLPFGSLKMGTVFIMVSPETDAPHFLFEFIENGSTSVVILADLVPRKDIVHDPDYLKRFYETRDLEAIRRSIETAPQSEPYTCASLFVRSVVSPTAILCKMHDRAPSGHRGEDGLGAPMTEVVLPTIRKVFLAWIDAFRNGGREIMDDIDRRIMAKRDIQIKRHGIEVDFSTNLPRLFDEKITDRVVRAFRNAR